MKQPIMKVKISRHKNLNNEEVTGYSINLHVKVWKFLHKKRLIIKDNQGQIDVTPVFYTGLL